jgi:hypothetical protein
MTEDQEKEFVRYLCRHLVSLGCVHAPRIVTAQNPERKFFTSGFVMVLKDRWLLVTAGHVLEQINQLMRTSPERSYRFILADLFGIHASFSDPIPFEYRKPVCAGHDEDSGLDFAALELNLIERSLLEKNGVMPLYERNWKEQAGVQFTGYGMVGLPYQNMDLDKPNVAIVQPVFLRVFPIAEPPDALKKHTVPMLYAEIKEAPSDLEIEGMSGCPVFGFVEGKGDLQYYFVALQSGWLRKRRVIFAPLMSYLGSLLESAL